MTEQTNLNDLINDVTEEIRSESKPATSEEEVQQTFETERKRKELLLLSSDGEVKKSAAFINKASAKVIERLYAEHEARRLDESAMFLCDLAISKFAMLMGGLDAIEKPDEMEKELQENPLLKKDLKVVMRWLTPFIPLLGVLSGGDTVGKYMWKKSHQENHDHDTREANPNE